MRVRVASGTSCGMLPANSAATRMRSLKRIQVLGVAQSAGHLQQRVGFHVITAVDRRSGPVENLRLHGARYLRQAGIVRIRRTQLVHVVQCAVVIGFEHIALCEPRSRQIEQLRFLFFMRLLDACGSQFTLQSRDRLWRRTQAAQRRQKPVRIKGMVLVDCPLRGLREPFEQFPVLRLNRGDACTRLPRLLQIVDGVVVVRIDQMILLQTGVEQRHQARDVALRAAAPQFIAQLSRFGAAERLRPRRFVDQLRSPVEVLRVDGGLDLGGPEFGPQSGNSSIERRQAAVVRRDAAGRLERLQRHIEFPLIQRGLHPRNEDFEQPLQSLARLAVRRIQHQGTAIERQSTAFGRLDEVPVEHRLLGFLDEEVDVFFGGGAAAGRRARGGGGRGCRSLRCGPSRRGCGAGGGCRADRGYGAGRRCAAAKVDECGGSRDQRSGEARRGDPGDSRGGRRRARRRSSAVIGEQHDARGEFLVSACESFGQLAGSTGKVTSAEICRCSTAEVHAAALSAASSAMMTQCAVSD